MAIGDTVQANLMRVDTTPLLQAQIRSSEQIGNAIAGLGRDIGSGIQKFMQNKKEGEAADMQIGALLQNMSPERQKEIQSGEGELGKSLSKFLSGELGISKKKALLGSLMTINTADQLKREEAMAAERFKQQQVINNLNRQLIQGQIDDRLRDKATNQSLAKFMMQPVETPTPEFSALQREYRPEQIPGTPEFIAMQEEPIPARPSIIAKTITEQPDFQRFVKQDSPAVAQLPDSVKRLGRSIQDKVQSGELTNEAGMIAINNLVGEGLSPSDALAREKYEDQKAEDVKQTETAKIESTNNLTDFYNETKSLLDKINEKGVDVTGPIEGTSIYRFFSKIGDTEDEQVRRRLEMFTRKLTLDAAQNLKGALSDKDIRFLVEQAPDMDDNPSVWKQYMGDLKTRLERNAKQKGIEFDATKPPQQSSNTIDPSAPASQATLDELEKKRQLRSKRAGL